MGTWVAGGGVSCRGEKLRRGREGDRWSGLGESGVGRGGEVLVCVLRVGGGGGTEGELEKGRGPEAVCGIRYESYESCG